jgi:hypothetical protein
MTAAWLTLTVSSTARRVEHSQGLPSAVGTIAAIAALPAVPTARGDVPNGNARHVPAGRGLPFVGLPAHAADCVFAVDDARMHAISREPWDRSDPRAIPYDATAPPAVLRRV